MCKIAGTSSKRVFTRESCLTLPCSPTLPQDGDTTGLEVVNESPAGNRRCPSLRSLHHMSRCVLHRERYRSRSLCDSPSVSPSHLRIGGSCPKSSRNCLSGVDTTLPNETPMTVTDTANHVRSSVTAIGATIASNVKGKNIKSLAALSIPRPHVMVWRR